MRKIIFLVITLIFISVSPAAAAINEYYTYGGFSPVTIAFENIALIFSDNSYKGAVATLTLLGLFFGCAGGFVKMAAGKGGPLGWVIPFCMGAALYFSLFVPTTSIAIFDPVYNQNKVVAGVPVGVVYIAGMVNTIERFVVETYDNNATLAPVTSCGPLTSMQYQEFGGAVGLRLMRNTSDQYVQSSAASQTLLAYVNDCVIFEISRPGSTLTIDKLLTPGCGKTALEVMSAANNPANFTTSYFGASTGTTRTCQAAYTELTTFFDNPANTNQPGVNACAGTGFTDNARCQQILADVISGSSGENIDSNKFISNNTVVSITNNALLTGGGEATSSYLTQLNQAQSGSSSGFMAGIVNPYMIDAYVSYSFMLMPILVLFLVTPLWKNAFVLIISMIVWTSLLRCLDVITFHSWVTQYQMAAAAALKSSGMGIDAAMRLPMLSNQYLGTFASMRSSVFLLATAVSGALFKFGDSAMSRLADKVNADHGGGKEAVSDRGVAAKMAMDNAAGASRSTMMTALASGTHGWDNIGKGMAANEFNSAAGGRGTLDAYGGNAGSMVDGQATVAARNTAQSSTRAGNVTDAQARGAGKNEAAAQSAVLERMGVDGKTAGWSAGIATDQNLGQAKGFQAAHKEAEKGGYSGSIQDFQRDMSKVTTEKGFADSQGWQDFVKEKFNGNEQAAMQATTNVAAFQLGKHSGEVDQTMNGTGQTATGAGGAVGKVTGDSNLMSLASDSVRRAIAEQNADSSIKNDPKLYTQGHYTQAGQEKVAALEAGRRQERAEAIARGREASLPKQDRAQLQKLDKAQAKELKSEQGKMLKDKNYSADGKTLNQAGQQKMAEFQGKQQAERSTLRSNLMAGHVTKGDKAEMKKLEGQQAAERQAEQKRLLADNKFSTSLPDQSLKAQAAEAMKQTAGAPVDVAGKQQALEQNLKNGNFEGIKNDKAQLAGMSALTGKSEQELKAATPEQQRQAMQQAQEKLSAPDQSPKAQAAEAMKQTAGAPIDVAGKQQALEQNLKNGNFEGIKNDKAQLAGMSALTGKSEQELKAATPEQQRQAMQQAQEKLSAPDQSPKAQAAEAMKQSGGAPVDVAGKQQALEQNLKNGNFEGIKNDRAQLAGMSALTGKSEQELKAATPEQQRQAMQQAQEKLSAPDRSPKAQAAEAMKQTAGAPVDVAGKQQALEQNLKNGNFEGIKNDRAQLAGMSALTGKSEQELKAATPEQQRQAMQQAQEKLSAPDRSPKAQAAEAMKQTAGAPVDVAGKQQALEQNLKNGNFEGIKNDKAQLAGMSALTGKSEQELKAATPEQQRQAMQQAQEQFAKPAPRELNEAGQKRMAELGTKQESERAEHAQKLQEGHLSSKTKSELQTIDNKYESAKEGLKNEEGNFRKGQLTEEGYLAQMGNIAGSNQQSFKASTAYGDVDKKDVVDRTGALVMSQEKGSVGKKEHMQALAKELEGSGFKHTAKEINKMADAGKGFDFQMSRDKDGKITGFTASGGASATLKDKAMEDTGRLNQHTMKHVKDTRDQNLSGSDKLSGDRVLRDDTDVNKSGKMTTVQQGYVSDTYNKPNEVHGVQTVNVDGKPTTVVGDTSRDKDGKIIGGNVGNGVKVDTVGFTTDGNGATHQVRTTGVTNTAGKLVQGQRSEKVGSELVEQVKDQGGNTTGVALTVREGSNSTPNASVRAQGGTHVDVSSSYKFGKNVSNVQTLSGSASQDKFGDGAQLGVGTAATAVAIGERSVAVASEKVNQVSSIAAAVKPKAQKPGAPGDAPSLKNNPVEYLKEKIQGVRNPEVGKDPYTGASVRKNPERWNKGGNTAPTSHVDDIKDIPRPSHANPPKPGKPTDFSNTKPADMSGGLGSTGRSVDGPAPSAAPARPAAPAKPSANTNSSYDGFTNTSVSKAPASYDGFTNSTVSRGPAAQNAGIPKPAAAKVGSKPVSSVKAPAKPGGTTVKVRPSK